jgi:hypothetical protein
MNGYCRKKEYIESAVKDHSHAGRVDLLHQAEKKASEVQAGRQRGRIWHFS